MIALAFLGGAPPGVWAATGFVCGAVAATLLWLAVLPLAGDHDPDDAAEPRRQPWP